MAPVDHLRASQADGAAPPRCFICGQALAGPWFCQIPLREGGFMLLCSPTCTLTYCKAVHLPQPQAESPAHESPLIFHPAQDRPEP